MRLNIDPEKEDLSLITTYSYPSSSQCTANVKGIRKGSTVFYCSNKAYAAIAESKPKVGDRGYLNVWKNKIKKPVKTAVYLPKRFGTPNEFQEISDGAQQFAKDFTLPMVKISSNIL